MPESNYQIQAASIATADGIPSPLNELIAAQAAHESGNFTSNLFKTINNSFGYGCAKSSYQIGCYQSSNGASFAKYSSFTDSVHEITAYIKRKQGSTFPSDLSTITTPSEYAYWLKKNNYYEDSFENYANGIAEFYDGSKPYATGSPSKNTFGSVQQSQVNLTNDFKQINQNIEGLEPIENAPGVIWGQRNNALEAFDWIGLKQYLLYLCSTYYPESLIPFIELIPRFFTEVPYLTSQDNNNGTNTSQNDNLQASSSNIQNNSFQTPVGLDRRFVQNALRQNSQTENGGIDLLTIDPFQETTSQLNKLNAAGEEFYKKRGFGYKIFGMIDLTPSIQGIETSKAGTVGFTSIEIEGGSQVNNNMSLITIEMLDVQGNKFLDINSPWSFILNSRPNEVSSDFYFRYGWQVRIPDSSPNDTKKDMQAKKFWEHPGWGLFDLQGGKNIKDYISSIAKTCDNTITLTQSSNPSSFQTPGYMLNHTTGFYQIDENTRQLGFENYLTLTLRNPEIKINPSDGSITGVLYLMNVSTVANCLCPLVYAKNMQSLVQKAKNGTTDLLTFMAYFFADNNAYLNSSFMKNPNNIPPSSIIKVKQNTYKDSKGHQVTSINPESIRSFISVIGSVPSTDDSSNNVQQPNNFYPLLDPSSIQIKISSDAMGDLNTALYNNDSSKSLIWWVNEVFQDNYLSTLSAVGQITSGADLTDNFIISYEYDKAKLDNQAANVKPINNVSKDDYTSRLSAQDDVFSFRFRGSLVESLSIEKLDTPSLFKVQLEKELSDTILQTPNSLTNKDVQNISNPDATPSVHKTAAETLNEGLIEQARGLAAFAKDPGKAIAALTSTNTKQIVYYVANDAVTYVNKREYLAMLYSQMMGASIKCIAHPWVKIGIPVGIKGTGFFDGPYLVTKIKHSMTSDNKFVSDISACRIINQSEFQRQQDNLTRLQQLSQNAPGIKMAEELPFFAIKNNLSTAKPTIPATLPLAPPTTSIPTKVIPKYNQEEAILSKIKSNALNEWNVYSSQDTSSNVIQIQKYQTVSGSVGNDVAALQNNWNFDFVNWCIQKALGMYDIYSVYGINAKNSISNNVLNIFPSTLSSSESIYNQFVTQSNIMTDISSIVINSTQNTSSVYTYTPNDLLFMFFQNGGILSDNSVHESNIFIGIIVNWTANNVEINNNQNYGIFQVIFGDYINNKINAPDSTTPGVLKSINLQLNNLSNINFSEVSFGRFLGFGVI